MKKKIRLNGSNEIGRSVERSLDEYFRKLDGEQPHDIYDMVIGHVEKPLLETVLGRANGNQTQAADMLGINRNTLRKKIDRQAALIERARRTDGVPSHGRPRSRQALISVSDKTGRRRIRARASRGSGVQILSTGGTAKALAEAGIAVTEVGELHRLSRDARRPREDAASEGPRRHPRAPRPAGAHGGDRAARDRADRPRRRQPLPVRGRPSRGPAARWTTRSRTSTSAARRWCARRRRTAQHVARGGRPGRLRGAARGDRANGGALSAATRFALAQKAFAHTAAYDGAISNWLDRARPRRRGGGVSRRASTCSSARCRTCATARTRTSSAAFYRDEQPAPGSDRRPTGSCRARSCRYNNIARRRRRAGSA